MKNWLKNRVENWRINVIFFCFFVVGAAIVGRLFYLQIIQKDLYRALARGQQSVFQLLRGERGDILFSNGQVLTINIKEKYIFALPDEITDKPKTAGSLAQILALDEKLVLETLEGDNSFAEIKTGLSADEEQALKKADLKGVYLNEGIFRKYPQGALAAQVAGFLGGEGKGQYGVEGYYDDILQGGESFQQKGRGLDDYFDPGNSAASSKGADIILTIDSNIQFVAEKILKEAKDNLEIEGGQIIVVEPSSGKIMALANFPTFDPNHYSEVEDFQIFQNAAIQKIFEPGSIFKSITMAAALDQGKVTPQTLYTDEGQVKIGGYTIYNFNQKTWGEMSMTGVLEHSINTGAVFAERKMGHGPFLDYIGKFGFFEPTGVDLQGEVSSENAEFKKGYEINYATAAFGQGIEITPIQMVRAFCAIANGGKLVRPYVVNRIIDDGDIAQTQPQLSYDNVISAKTASQLTAMLVSVVEQGSGKKAKIPGYYVAGKTGTAQVPWSSLGINQRGYSEKTWQSFIGFAPAFKPRFVILIKLDNPSADTAEASVVPLAGELGKYLVDYLEIPPDYE